MDAGEDNQEMRNSILTMPIEFEDGLLIQGNIEEIVESEAGVSAKKI